MPTSEKSFVRRERRWMCGFQNQMPGFVYQNLFFLCKFPPKKKYDTRFHFGTLFDYIISELTPACLGMTHRCFCFYCKIGVQQQHTLFGPVSQVSARRDCHSDIRIQFFEDILQGRWRTNSVWYGKTESMRLAGTMIGILTK